MGSDRVEFFVVHLRERNNVALKMTDREVDGASVIALDGRIVLGEESQALRLKLKNLLAEGKKKIVLNMDDIKYIDSAGLGILVAAHVSAKTQGAVLKRSATWAANSRKSCKSPSS